MTSLSNLLCTHQVKWQFFVVLSPQRRQARRRDSIKVRGPASKSSKYSTFKRINTSRGTNPQNMVVHRGIGLPDKFRTRLVWNQAIALTGFSSAITQVYSVRMNGPFDLKLHWVELNLSIMTCLLACIVVPCQGR